MSVWFLCSCESTLQTTLWCGYEAGLEVGQPVATLSGGCFAEYVVIAAKLCLPAGTMQKEVVALLTSGLTASIGLPAQSPLPCLHPLLISSFMPTASLQVQHATPTSCQQHFDWQHATAEESFTLLRSKVRLPRHHQSVVASIFV